MSLRPAHFHDVEALALIQAASFDSPWTAASLRVSMDAAGAMAIVSEATDSDTTGGIEGFILLRGGGGEAEILILAVAALRRRRGLGRALLAAGMAAAAQQGVETVFLEVEAGNTAAIGLYSGAGFETFGRRPAYYRRKHAPPADALVMRRSLAAPA